MISTLDRKLLRDIVGMKGQILAVSLVMACGVGMMIAAHGIILSLENTRDAYYARHRMPDLFGHVESAPLSMAERMSRIPGVASVDLRVVSGAVLDMEGMKEPVRAKLVSLPDADVPHLNQIFLRSGRLPESGEQRAVVVSEAFALAHHLRPGDRVAAIINGRRDHLDICGVGLSPEFVFEAAPGQTLPDSRHYGVFWMHYDALAIAYDLEGAFNDYCMDLSPGASPKQVIEELDLMLAPYGTTGAYERKDHASSRRLDDELRIVRALAVAYPFIFLCVAAFMVNAVLMRLVRLQREQIAQLKALGYSSRQVGRHYLNYALVIVVFGGLIGIYSGQHLGGAMLGVYTTLFHFPSLTFQVDQAALVGGLLTSTLAAMLGVAGAVWMAARLSPAEAMRPEPPTDFKPSWLERLGVTKGSGLVFRMALRNIERRPAQASFAVVGLALATGLLVLPGGLADSVDYLLTYQWNDHYRQHVMLFTRDSATNRARYDLRHLPGALDVEPFRGFMARVRHGHHMRITYVMSFDENCGLIQPRDLAGRPMEMPPEGLIMSQKLGEVLGVKVGDKIQMQALEGHCESREIGVRGFMADFYGLAVYMNIGTAQRHLRETDTMTGALINLDTRRWDEFMDEVKQQPEIDGVSVKKDQLQAFRASTGQSIGMLRELFRWMAVIVAFGVVYNSARIALSERGRDLATLRVVGMTKREITGILLGELSLLVLVALPLGLFFGHLVARYVIAAVSTETVRLPAVIHPATYASSVLIVLAATGASFALVTRLLSKLDLVAVLKARD
ncbi:MAG: ABC transporter permease [Prosthecobacter sp.]|jgi:putative ABC transport system permease protein|uniref:ABC transporter permease n=1 Tax=Prosthecobacter sp. TaxID=1965333 RepID=UPI001A06F015|nr:ABC transporter permease [Prosthecobacter sp.]MBE2285149.1 ABC transporter permease [Prosthecobacter sp.]